MHQTKILDIKINKITTEEILEKIKSFLLSDKNSPLDKGGWGVEKITGIDLIYKICEAEFIKDKKIYLLGAGEGIAEEAARVLSGKYPYLNIVGAEEGIPAAIFNFQFSIFPPMADPPKVDNKYPISNIQFLIKIN